jgi:hypothetical protein
MTFHALNETVEWLMEKTATNSADAIGLWTQGLPSTFFERRTFLQKSLLIPTSRGLKLYSDFLAVLKRTSLIRSPSPPTV